jgi:hypothetical protein
MAPRFDCGTGFGYNTCADRRNNTASTKGREQDNRRNWRFAMGQKTARFMRPNQTDGWRVGLGHCVLRPGREAPQRPIPKPNLAPFRPIKSRIKSSNAASASLSGTATIAPISI